MPSDVATVAPIQPAQPIRGLRLIVEIVVRSRGGGLLVRGGGNRRSGVAQQARGAQQYEHEAEASQQRDIHSLSPANEGR
jgi:hypothetical protein